MSTKARRGGETDGTGSLKGPPRASSSLRVSAGPGLGHVLQARTLVQGACIGFPRHLLVPTLGQALCWVLLGRTL